MTDNGTYQEPDPFNRYMVGGTLTTVSILNPPHGRMTTDEALNLAAWLVAVADPAQERFPAVLDAVMGT